MLLRFSVENCLSIRRSQELSFAASSLKDRADGLIQCEAVESGAVVPAAVVYGANASGKTNLIRSIAAMKKLVMWSQTRLEPNDGVPIRKFLLDPECSGKPSRFELDFMLDGVRYHYGFEASGEAFTSEWLYGFPKAHRRKMFERYFQEFHFGRWLSGQNGSIAGLTRNNSLFLSAAAQNGHPQLSPVYEYFKQMVVYDQIFVGASEASMQFAEEGLDERVIWFLEAIDTGVTGYRSKDVKIPEKSKNIRREMEALIGKLTGQKISLHPGDEDRLQSIELAHRGSAGEEFHLAMETESSGTRRLLIVLSQLFRALDRGLPIFIDELDASLHTHACEAILELFCSPAINRFGAQLIATTHDTNLMRSSFFRRDQLWFAEKNLEGASEIFPLTDIRTRKGDNVELGYLQGRYGAVPSENPVSRLVEAI